MVLRLFLAFNYCFLFGTFCVIDFFLRFYHSIFYLLRIGLDGFSIFSASNQMARDTNFIS